MMSEPSLRTLLDWNHRIVLGDLLAMEAHLAVMGRGEVKDSWCLLKHKVHALEHGVREAISHAERLGLDSSKYREFYKKLESLPDTPSIKDVVNLRNEWLTIAGFETSPECPICSVDISEELITRIKQLEEKLEGSAEGGASKHEEEDRVGLPEYLLLSLAFTFVIATLLIAR